ncbi:MAG: methyltransferase [Bacteroidetes bacterium]|nr:MAG: methyltransferase [Bacteroidota bacterium]
MKIGTDAMLMGSLAQPVDAQNILDIGTGTGVLALMMAQQCPHAIIDAVEPDSIMAVRAAENFENSTWDYRLTLYNEALQEYTNLGIIHYEYILCNPPYFEPSPTTRPDRINARSTVTLTFDELMAYGEQLLDAQGKMGVIVPEGEYEKLLVAAQKVGLHPVRQVLISSFENSPVIRRVTEFAKKAPVEVEQDSLFIYNEDKTWSEKYTVLTAEFHNLDKEA